MKKKLISSSPNRFIAKFQIETTFILILRSFFSNK